MCGRIELTLTQNMRLALQGLFHIADRSADRARILVSRNPGRPAT